MALAPTYQQQVARFRQFQRVREASDDGGLEGLVIDETLTRLGRAFYDVFYRHWQTPPEAGFHTIRVVEEPRPGRGTLVQVNVNDASIYQTRLQPGADALGNHPLRAAQRTYRYLQSGQGTLTIY